MLVVRSRREITRLLGEKLRRSNCRIIITFSKVVKLQVFGSGAFRLVVSSVVLPGLSNFRLSGRVEGVGPTVPVLVLATLKSASSGLRKFSTNTSSCVIGPFSFERLGTHVGMLLGHSTRGVQRMPRRLVCTSLGVGLGDGAMCEGRYRVGLSPGRCGLLICVMRGTRHMLDHMRVTSGM